MPSPLPVYIVPPPSGALSYDQLVLNGLAGAAGDYVRLAIFAVVIGCAVISLGVWTAATLLAVKR